MSLLRDIYVAMVLKEPRCVALQVMLARLFGQNGERKVQEMNARLRALTTVQTTDGDEKFHFGDNRSISNAKTKGSVESGWYGEKHTFGRSTVRLLLCIVFK